MNKMRNYGLRIWYEIKKKWPGFIVGIVFSFIIMLGTPVKNYFLKPYVVEKKIDLYIRKNDSINYVCKEQLKEKLSEGIYLQHEQIQIQQFKAINEKLDLLIRIYSYENYDTINLYSSR